MKLDLSCVLSSGIAGRRVMEDVIKEVREADEAVVVVTTGEITMDRSPEFHRALVELCERKPKVLVIEMSEVKHIDSAGVGTLVEIFRRVKQFGGRMALVGMNVRVKSVFEITRLNLFLPIFDDLDEAMRS